jgi:CDP-diacylglycerol--glycerol-3-phosphate 3-phosphatidyltransferase
LERQHIGIVKRANFREDIWNLPNVLTMGRIAVIPLICWLLAEGTPLYCLIAAWLFGAAAFTDWLDGYIARKRGLESMTGKFLDPLADKLLVMAVFIVLLPMHRISVWFVVLSLTREISITALRALAAGEGIIIAAEWGDDRTRLKGALAIASALSKLAAGAKLKPVAKPTAKPLPPPKAPMRPAVFKSKFGKR